jgi:hypothetical protein
MTPLPDWLVERAALDEVPAESRDRIDRADPDELAERIAALREANAKELSGYPAGPAVRTIESRAATVARRRSERRRNRRLTALGIVASAAAVLLVTRVVIDRPADEGDVVASTKHEEITRAKGMPRLLAFRQAGERVEKLERDSLVRAGDVIQLRYNAGGHGYGVIASLDGAGVVTLHFPISEDAPPQATAVARDTTSLPHAYALDDAPRFERFFFITANEPIDVQQSLAALHSLARRADSADASLDLPAGFRQWSLRLRKPESP